MPRFFFDVFLESGVVRDPGGMLFECPARAVAAADALARRLGATRAESCGSGSCVRVRDQRNAEIYRSPIVPRV